jgi:adenylate cyclase
MWRATAHRLRLVNPKIKDHRGRIVKTTGDGILVEFASVVDALRCAAEVQRGMAERNVDIPKESQRQHGADHRCDPPERGSR